MCLWRLSKALAVCFVGVRLGEIFFWGEFWVAGVYRLLLISIIHVFLSLAPKANPRRILRKTPVGATCRQEVLFFASKGLLRVLEFSRITLITLITPYIMGFCDFSIKRLKKVVFLFLRGRTFLANKS